MVNSLIVVGLLLASALSAGETQLSKPVNQMSILQLDDGGPKGRKKLAGIPATIEASDVPAVPNKTLIQLTVNLSERGF